MAAPASPSSLPRLPSPPPFTEVQIGPKSPGIGGTSNTTTSDTGGGAKVEQGSERRMRPGTKAVDMATGPPLKPLGEVESAFQLQEHLKALFTHHTMSPESHTTKPLTHDTALLIAQPPSNVDRDLWLYELCRLLVIQANSLLVSFFADSPPCSASTCPEMRASEWQYLCAVHEPPKPCCAIDYCCHTLDWAATTLASQKHFPSRLTLGNEASGGSQAGVRQLTNIMRRVYRIFAHAWFQHRSVFWQVEGNEGLYMLFKTVCDVYDLIQQENYTIPPEAEGLTAKEDSSATSQQAQQQDTTTSTKPILKPQPPEPATPTANPDGADTTTALSTGATTRRHKSTHSFSTSVAAIAEGDEEDSPTKEKPARVPTALKDTPSPQPIQPEEKMEKSGESSPTKGDSGTTYSETSSDEKANTTDEAKDGQAETEISNDGEKGGGDEAPESGAAAPDAPKPIEADS